jgi:hypothetical protein
MREVLLHISEYATQYHESTHTTRPKKPKMKMIYVVMTA